MPVKLVDVELTRPEALPVVSARYDWLRVLVRFQGRPLGYVGVENVPARLEPSGLRAHALAKLGWPTWEALLGRRWTEVPAGVEHELPPVSVIVCTRNRADLLQGCLAALAAQRYPDYEVVVVDNAPTDDSTLETAGRFEVRYIAEPRPGLDWARNRGLTAARFAIVAYTDDDARPDPGWLAGLVAGFSSPDVHAVTGFVAPAELDTDAQLAFEDVYGGMGKGFKLQIHSRRGWKTPTYHPEHYGVGCNMAFRREALEQLGGFDTALDVGTLTGGGGDLDIFQRVIESGGAIVYRPDAVIRHKHRRSWAGLQRQLFDNGRAYSAVLWATFLRARGRERLAVLAAYWRWVTTWHGRRILRRVFRRGERLPMKFLLAEVRGAALGPILYTLARRRARKLV